MSEQRGRFWVGRRDRPAKPLGMPDRAVLLCRQSITGAKSISLEDQELHNRRWAQQQGYQIVQVMRSPNVRGWQDDRRDHEAVLALAQAGEIEVAVAYDVARAARTMRIMEGWAHTLEQLGVRLEFASAPMANTPMGRQMLTMLAEMETQQRSVRMQDLFEDAMGRRGWWHGNVPYGYRRAGKSLEVDEERAPLVRGMFERRAQGWGTGKIAGWMNEQGAVTSGGAPWDSDAVRTVVNNPAYLGHVHRHGEVVHEHAHPAIVDQELWERVRVHDGVRGAVRHKHADHWLEGLVVHVCGARCYRRTWQRSGRSGGGESYECSSVGRARQGRGPDCVVRPLRKSERMVEGAARGALARAVDGMLPWADAVRRAEANAGGKEAVDARSKVGKALARLDARLERATELALSGRIPMDRFDQEREAVQGERDRLAAELAALPQPPDPELFRATSEVMTTAALAARHGDGSDLRVLVTALGTVEMGPGGVRLLLRPDLRDLLPDPPTAPYPGRAAYGARTLA